MAVEQEAAGHNNILPHTQNTNNGGPAKPLTGEHVGLRVCPT